MTLNEAQRWGLTHVNDMDRWRRSLLSMCWPVREVELTQLKRFYKCFFRHFMFVLNFWIWSGIPEPKPAVIVFLLLRFYAFNNPCLRATSKKNI